MRRISGVLWDEVHLLCRPDDPSPGAAEQAQAVYDGLCDALAAEAAGAILTGETVFLRDIRRDYGPVAGARRSVLDAAGLAYAPAEPVWIEQPPIGGSALTVMATAMLPRRPAAASVISVPARTACSCPTCALPAGQVVRAGNQTMLRAANVAGRGRGAFEEAYAMFEAAKQLVEAAGMVFTDVVRTWIFLRDIDRDYDEFNRARRAFFRDTGIEVKPASTGVGGAPVGAAHDFSMALCAVRSDPAPAVGVMSTPTLNEAWAYGSDFSRGLRVTDANQTTLYVSGTASINERGETVHVGDPRRQAERMLENIETLLAGQGAGFSDLVSVVTYVKNPADAGVVETVFAERAFEGFPNALVEAPLCRPELLCEAEAVAVVPHERRV